MFNSINRPRRSVVVLLLWGPPKIHGELRTLGLAVAERTGSRTSAERAGHGSGEGQPGHEAVGHGSDLGQVGGMPQVEVVLLVAPHAMPFAQLGCDPRVGFPDQGR